MLNGTYLVCVAAANDVGCIIGGGCNGMIPLTDYYTGPTLSGALVERLSVWSAPSNPSYGRTSVASGPGAPPPPHVEHATGGMVLLRLLQPADDGGSPVTSFVLSQTQSADPMQLPAAVTTVVAALLGETEYVVAALAAQQSYVFSVAAITAASQCSSEAARLWSPPTIVNTTSGSAPSAPLRVQVLSATGGSMQIGFDSPLDLGGATTVTTSYHAAFGANSSALHTLSDSVFPSLKNRTFTMSGLESSTLYYVTAWASNAFGVGPQSDAVAVRTTATSAPGAPSNVQAVNITGGAVFVQFLAPADTGGAPLGFYTVTATATTGAFNLVTASSDGSPIFVSGLDAGTKYDVRVQASNSFSSAGHSSSAVLITTNSALPPTVPRMFTAVNVTGGLAPLTWLAPDDYGGGRLVEYKLNLTETSAGKTLELAVPVPHSKADPIVYNAHGLRAQRQYCATIGLLSSTGLGATATVCFITSMQTPPSSPSGFKVLNTTGGSVAVSFAAPLDNGGAPVSATQVTFSLQSTSSITTLGDILLGDTGRVTVYGLANDTQYFF